MFAMNIWRCTHFFPKDAQQNFDGIDWLAQLPHTKASNGPNALSKALLLCWQIWEARNNCIFKEIVPHPARALLMARRIGLDYWKINNLAATGFVIHDWNGNVRLAGGCHS
ncbi:PREDICTED: uncharacterized protein LOC107881203 [Prunus mume]|uniref:Uncharacterized protein LOC107881203 n=1 Tax=Prunus mume TaxID=102107 RepID=A0ABM1LRF4_PRUMU|nr:PREDICTED: uncharacterized protein LOC107881203 [Prunus mume]